MYKTLKAECARRGISWKQLADESGIKYVTLTKKLYDGVGFTLEQAVAIKTAIGVEMPIEELFAWEK